MYTENSVFELNFKRLQLRRTMKNLLSTLIFGGAASSLIASQIPIGDENPEFKPQVFTHHEINPSIKVLKHKEKTYKYTKIVGGIEYNFFRPDGLNFGAYMGYSHSNSKTFFVADWNLKYKFILDEYSMVVAPVVGLSNTSNFTTNSFGDSYQVYCGKLNAGLAAEYAVKDFGFVNFGVHYFKDITSSLILYKGNDFWGRHYKNPYGLKATFDLRIPNIISKDIVIGGFYAKTLKTCYEEYGTTLAVNFEF